MRYVIGSGNTRKLNKNNPYANNNTTYTVQYRIERQIFTKVTHPPAAVSFFHTLVNNNLLHPLHSRGVGEVQHGKLNTQGIHQIRCVVGILYKVFVRNALLEEVVAKGRGAVGIRGGVGEEWRHVS